MSHHWSEEPRRPSIIAKIGWGMAGLLFLALAVSLPQTIYVILHPSRFKGFEVTSSWWALAATIAVSWIVGRKAWRVFRHDKLTSAQISSIKPGMTEPEVIGLVGHPNKIEQVRDGKTIWSYGTFIPDWIEFKDGHVTSALG
jgi:hypothetical protein